MKKLRDATLLFLIRKSEDKIQDICLAMKKRGFGAGRWNGVGGKVQAESGEKVEDAARRETKEEINVSVNECQKIAELAFYFPHNPDWDQLVHVYFAEKWDGEPFESEEMRPQWFSVPEIPFETMWPDDVFWLPEALKGRCVKAKFKFGEGDIIKMKQIRCVDSLAAA